MDPCLRTLAFPSWKDWCWSWNSNLLATWSEELTHLKRPWCWERLKAGGEGDDRGWDDWMALLSQWTWIWVNSGSSRWTGRAGVLQSMGSQRVRHDWATELNWTNSRKNIIQMLTFYTTSRTVTPLVHWSKTCWTWDLAFYLIVMWLQRNSWTFKKISKMGKIIKLIHHKFTVRTESMYLKLRKVTLYILEAQFVGCRPVFY